MGKPWAEWLERGRDTPCRHQEAGGRLRPPAPVTPAPQRFCPPPTLTQSTHALRAQLIADATVGANEIGPKLLAQMVDMHFHRIAGHFLVPAVQFFFNLLA